MPVSAPAATVMPPSSSPGAGPRRAQRTGRMFGGVTEAEAGNFSREGLKVEERSKPRSNNSAALRVRSLAEDDPITTVMRRRPLRVAVATTLKPPAQTEPGLVPAG